MEDLQGLFSKAGKPVINFGGEEVSIWRDISINTGQFVEISFVRYSQTYLQGIRVHIDGGKGYIFVPDLSTEKIQAPVFWTDTAPQVFQFQCVTRKQEGVMRVWNVYRKPDGSMGFGAGNAGLFVELIDDGSYIFHCSSTPGEVDFDDLVFKLVLK